MAAIQALLIAVTLTVGTAAAAVDATGRRGYGVLKMLAASGYLALAAHLGAQDTAYGQLILVGLMLSWLGDLFLVGRSDRWTLTGLGSFLLAHLAYVAAFLVLGVDPVPTAAGAVVVAVTAGVALRWLIGRGLPHRMRVPVAIYLLAIGAMVSLALGTGLPVLAAGAVAFLASDFLVARQRFVDPSPANRLIGLPLYLAAQLLIVSSV